jgi:hypothetical protein
MDFLTGFVRHIQINSIPLGGKHVESIATFGYEEREIDSQVASLKKEQE